MQSIQKVAKGLKNRMVIDLPHELGANKIEVVLRSTGYKKDNIISQLEKEIDIGLCSQISIRSHKEIFDSLKEKYATF